MFVAKASSFFASHVPIHFGKIYILMVRSTSLLVPTRHCTPFLQLLMVKSSFGRAKNSFLLVLNPKLCSKMFMCLRVCLRYIVTVSIMYIFCLFFFIVFDGYITSKAPWFLSGARYEFHLWRLDQTLPEQLGSDGRWEGPRKDRDG